MKPKSDGSLEKLADKAAEEKFTHCGHFYEHPELPTQIGITQQELKNTILSALSEATAALEEKVKNLERTGINSLRDQRDLALEALRSLDLSYGRAQDEEVQSKIDLALSGAEAPTPVLQVSKAEELANATTRSPHDE